MKVSQKVTSWIEYEINPDNEKDVLNYLKDNKEDMYAMDNLINENPDWIIHIDNDIMLELSETISVEENQYNPTIEVTGDKGEDLFNNAQHLFKK